MNHGTGKADHSETPGEDSEVLAEALKAAGRQETEDVRTAGGLQVTEDVREDQGDSPKEGRLADMKTGEER